MRRPRPLPPLLAAALLAGCGSYDPPVAADHAAPAYQADLRDCNEDAAKAASKLAGATFRRWVLYPVSYRSLKREQVRVCLDKKGYTLPG